jgi:predicted nucleic acid-binding protein
MIGLKLYESRLDKGYSLTDCISMSVMRDRNLTEMLTHDRHFAQEGFIILL